MKKDHFIVILFIGFIFVHRTSSAKQEIIPIFENLAALHSPPRHYPIWVCGNISEAGFKIQCADLDSSETEGPKAALEINFGLNGIKHFFYPRHGQPLHDCTEMRAEIKKLITGHRDFCVRGDMGEFFAKSNSIGWVFDGIKSDKGSVCWLDDC